MFNLLVKKIIYYKKLIIIHTDLEVTLHSLQINQFKMIIHNIKILIPMIIL